MAFLVDGFQTLVSFSLAVGIFVREVEVKPPHFKGGGPIDVTSMRNFIWKTQLPKWLTELDELDMVVQYDPVVFGLIANGFGGGVLAQINSNQLILLRFPDLSLVSFWGWIDEFTPQSMKKGELPLADMKIHISNVPLPGYTGRTNSQARSGVRESGPSYSAPPSVNLGTFYGATLSVP